MDPGPTAAATHCSNCSWCYSKDAPLQAGSGDPSELFNLPRGQSTQHRSTSQALAQLGRRGGSQVAALETDIPLVQVRVEWLSPDCHFWEFHTCLPVVGARRARASTIR